MAGSFYERAQRFLQRRATAYRLTFAGEAHTKRVLTDLARFCRATRSTAHADPYMAARLDGRREVWLRIQEHLDLPEEELFRRYAGAQKEPDGESG